MGQNSRKILFSSVCTLLFIFVFYPLDVFRSDTKYYDPVKSEVAISSDDYSIDEAKNLDFASMEAKKYLGTNGHYYSRFTFKNQKSVAEHFVLSFRPPVSKITVWREKSPGHFEQIGSSGFLVPHEDRKIDSVRFSFPFSLESGDTVRLIVKTTSIYPVKLLGDFTTRKDFAKLNKQDLHLFHMVLGSLIAILFLNLVLFAWTRKLVYLTYAAMLLGSHLLSFLSIYGLINYHTPSWLLPYSLYAMNLFINLFVISIAIFTHVFLELDKEAKWLQAFPKILVGLALLMIVFGLFTVTKEYAELVDILSLFTLIFALVAGFVTAVKGKSSGGFFLVGFGALAVVSILYIFQEQGLINWGEPLNKALLFSALFEALLFSVALGLRMRNIQTELVRHKSPLYELLNITQKDSDFSSTKVIVPKKIKLSILYLDVVAFSETAKRFPLDQFFGEYQKSVKGIKKIIKRYGGIVDGTSGDAILCYFGFDLQTGTVQESHENIAIHCAIDIQTAVIKQNRDNAQNCRPQFPLRIGLESDDILFGDIGDITQPRITGLGQAVNYVTRLEGGCAPQSIMMSDSFYRKISRSLQERCHRKYFAVKHLDALQIAHEISVMEANTSHINYLENAQTRRIDVVSKIGEFVICSTAESYFHLLSDQCYLSVGVEISLRYEGSESSAQPLEFFVRVCESYIEGKNYVHVAELLGCSNLARSAIEAEIARNFNEVS